MSYNQLISRPIKTNAKQGSYRPAFFDLAAFNLSNVEFHSRMFNEGEAELALLTEQFSFAYLREDKLRTIHAYDSQGELIPFSQFNNHFNISISSSNLFKSGKYLSRIFRPTRFGAFFKNIDVNINNSIPISKVDGLSVISVDLAKSLGYTKAEANESAQFTMFYKEGLVKGHCVFSDKIEHDVIVYGKDNIKSEIKFNSESFYLAIEPTKLSDTLRIDIQSILNLWDLFGQKQYFAWSVEGVNKFKEDLFSGKLINWLDNFDDIDPEDHDNENWTLRKALWHKIDYRRFPGLVRQAWSLFRSSMLNFAENKNGTPVFRIPVPSGIRGYFRVDLRNHDKDGSFSLSSDKTDVELDKYGNIWINPQIIEDFLSVKGGADLDDSAGIIPVEDGKAIIYRNPNQYGEYGLHSITYLDNLGPKEVNKIINIIPPKKVSKPKEEKQESTGNKLFDAYLKESKKEEEPISYTRDNLLRTYTKISANSANIGTAANGEMHRSAIGITNKSLMKSFMKAFNWNLERVIDSTVKEGISSSEDMEAVSLMIEKIIDDKIPTAKSLVHRFPEKKQPLVTVAEDHPLDEMLDAIKILIKHTDKEILGEGSVSKGNRVKGYIDRIEVPITEIGIANIENQMIDAAQTHLKSYNRSMAIMLDQTKKLKVYERESIRRKEIERIQSELRESFCQYEDEEKREITKHWAYQIYKSERAVHDSILWMEGISDYTIQMFGKVGIGYQIKKNGTIERYNQASKEMIKVEQIRIWSSKELKAELYKESQEIIICAGKVLIGNDEHNLGDECKIQEGDYLVREVVQSISKKTYRPLKNSLTLYLA
ncbi:MAG: hypothetical protein CMF23_18240 [Ignavibacteriae bacterium]|nr:hypothetical protein [Ignavibacteriota bacterium]